MPAIEPKRILKAMEARNLGARVAFNFEDFRTQCDQYLDKVRQSAQQLIDEARREAELIRRQTHEDAKVQGLKEAMQEADAIIEQRASELARKKVQQELQSLLPAMKAAAEQLSHEYERWLSRWEASAIRLSVAVAEKLMTRELKHHPEAGRKMIVQALQLVSSVKRLTVRLNPRDLQTLGEAAEQFVADVAEADEVVFVPDDSIASGGCQLDTQHGTIDARIETLLDRVTAELLQEDDMGT